MKQLFNNAITKAEYLRFAASLGHVCNTHGEHVSDGSIEADDCWYREVGYAFCKLIKDEDFARLTENNLAEFIRAIDSKKIEDSEE